MEIHDNAEHQIFDQELLIKNALGTTLQLGMCAINFASIERAPRYTPERHENDAEHSFMLSLIAPELASQLQPELEPGLVAQFAVVHDLVELEAGDTVTFTLTAADIVRKEQAEHSATERLGKKLPPYTAALLLRYESQSEPEAQFVRLVDKLLPLIANIYGPGKQVMAESFDIHSSRALIEAETICSERLFRKFPDAGLESVHAIRHLLARHFQKIFDIDA
jgi:5'-deoxynucleotidase YfbR-like HD superfamily hydrolase